MNSTQQDLGKWIQDLAIRSGTEWLGGVQRNSAFWQLVASGELNQQQLNEESIRYIRDETDRFIRSLTVMSWDYYNALIELGHTYNPPFFEQAVAREPTTRPSASAAADLPQTRLELQGLVGQDALSSFVMKNEQAEPDEVSFTVSEFAAPNGLASFRPPLSIQPPRFTLTRNEQRRVTLKLPLLKDLFVPDQHYTAIIRVQCHNPFEFSVDVVAGAAAKPAAAPLV